MGFFLGMLIVSFLINSAMLIPFIGFLYRFRLQRQKQDTKDAFNRPTPIFDKLNRKKAGTPLGGGFLIIFNTSVIFLLSLVIMYYFWIPITSVYNNTGSEIKILLFCFLSYGIIGLFDDLKKIFLGKSEKFFGLRLKHKLILESIIGLIAGYWLYNELKIEIMHIPLIGTFDLGIFYIFFAALVIISFANAYNITDGLDGLASGILMIALISFWVISSSILDSSLTLFIAVWLGAIVAFLYFNVFPARIFLGDVGALSFGATFAVIGLMLGKGFSLIIIGGIFVAEITTSFIQLLSKKYLKRKIFSVAPLHLFLQNRGWNETTIVFRAWLASIMLSILGLWFAFIT